MSMPLARLIDGSTISGASTSWHVNTTCPQGWILLTTCVVQRHLHVVHSRSTSRRSVANALVTQSHPSATTYCALSPSRLRGKLTISKHGCLTLVHRFIAQGLTSPSSLKQGSKLPINTTILSTLSRIKDSSPSATTLLIHGPRHGSHPQSLMKLYATQNSARDLLELFFSSLQSMCQDGPTFSMICTAEQ